MPDLMREISHSRSHRAHCRVLLYARALASKRTFGEIQDAEKLAALNVIAACWVAERLYILQVFLYECVCVSDGWWPLRREQ